MLDLHAHVLPGIDDGPRTLEDAVALARALANDGVEHVVATPHIYPGVFDNTPDRIADAFDRLRQAIADSDVRLTMTWAAEVRICPEIIDWLERRRLPLLNGSLVGPSAVLIELPDGQIPVGTDRLMARLVDHGITPLMAHPERNKAVMEQPGRLEALRRLGCRFQLTAGSLLGDFGSRAQNTALQLLEAGWIDVVGSDAHNLSGRRPRMAAARAWITERFGPERAERLFVTQPSEIAGVMSFAVQSGEHRLVFRDIPVAPVNDTGGDAWAASLGDLHGHLPPKTAQTAAPGADWGLTDFRIDAITQQLQQGTPDSLADTPPERLADTLPLTGSPPPRDPEEDWTLPTPVLMPLKRAERPRPAVRSVPPSQPVAPLRPAATVAPTPQVEDIEARLAADEPSHRPPSSPVATRVAPLVSAPVATAAASGAPDRHPQVMITSPAISATPHDKPSLARSGIVGMRLHEVTEAAPAPASTHATSVTPPRVTGTANPARPGLAQVQGLSTPARRPTQDADATPERPVRPQRSVAPQVSVESPLSVRVVPAVPHDLPSTTASPPGESPRGFRLSDLPALPARRGRPG
jgi:protein-tyrosine phosphatase